MCRRYTELVVTTREYMRCVTRIDPLWLPELVPTMYARVAPPPPPPVGARAPTAPARPAIVRGIGMIPGAPSAKRFQ